MGRRRQPRREVPRGVGPTPAWPAGARGSGCGSARRRAGPRAPRARFSSAARASAPTSAVRCSAISPSARWCQPPTIRPSTQAVGPPLPLRSNSSAASAARQVEGALLPAHRRRVEAGQQHRRRRCGRPRVDIVGQHVAGPLVERHLDRADVGQRALRDTHRPARPPGEIRARAGTERGEPPARQPGRGGPGLQASNPSGPPRRGGGPAVLAVDPRAGGPCPTTVAVEAEQEQHPRVRGDHGGRRAAPDRQRHGQGGQP